MHTALSPVRENPARPLRRFSGVERAAVLMLLVDADAAAEMLHRLDPEEVRILGQAMIAVADVSEAEVAQVLAPASTPRPAAGSAAESDPEPVVPSHCSSEQLAALLEGEQRQVVVALLAQLDFGRAVRVLEHLPVTAHAGIFRQVARLGPVSPGATALLTAVLARSRNRKTTRRHDADFVPHDPFTLAGSHPKPDPKPFTPITWSHNPACWPDTQTENRFRQDW